MAPSVRVLFMSRSTNDVDLSTILHRHEHHQFLYLFRGWGEVRVGGALMKLQRGDWLTLAPQVPHQLLIPARKTVACVAFQLKARLAPDWAGRFSGPPLTRVGEQRERLERAVNELLWARRRDELDLHLAGEALLGWVAVLLSAGRSQPPTSAPQDERLGRVLAWLEKHEGPTPEIRELARQAGLHPSYFTRLFRARTGLSPSAWIIRRRLEYAHSLVVFSSAKLNEIASLSGYRNYHHFFNQFTAQYGKSPSQLREARDRE